MNPPSTSQSIVLGGGCFWCLEAAYQLVRGVISVTSGYAGGHVENPTYPQVASKTTGHAEVVQIEFDPGLVTLTDILEIFWVIHDPTTKDRQGYDVGPEYRSIILYANEAQKQLAEASKATAQTHWDNPIVTEVVRLTKFYEAEPEHQNYFKKNPTQGYCQVIINPKLAKLRQKLAHALKPQEA